MAWMIPLYKPEKLKLTNYHEFFTFKRYPNANNTGGVIQTTAPPGPWPEEKLLIEAMPTV